MKKAGIYVRVSSADQRVASQLYDLRELASRRSFEVVKVYQDCGVSGRRARRPGMDDPVCEHIYLHRLRKTCATRWLEHGVPVRTVQAWLGHKNLETTMLYLGVTDSSQLRGNINAAAGD